MKVLINLVLLVLVFSAGYRAFRALGYDRYGITSSAPMGSFDALDVYLTEEMGLTKSQQSVLPVRDIPTTERMFRYSNPENPYESVTLLLDGANSLRGVVGVYWLADYGSRSPVMRFSQSYWRRMGGARKPHLTERSEGGLTVSEASFRDDGVSGTWRDWTEQGQRQVTIHLRLR